MGIYIYALKSPKHVVTVHTTDGQTMEAGIAAYAFKESHSLRPKTTGERLALARLERGNRLWEGHKLPLIQIPVHEDKMEVGGVVYPCWGTDYCDTPSPKKVGVIADIQVTKVGRKTVRKIIIDITNPEELPVRSETEQE